jgi:hypothetical protein
MTYSGQVVLEKKIFKWRPFLRLSPLWRGPGPLFEKFRIPFTQGWFIPSVIEIGLLVLEKIFKNVQRILLFCNCLPLEKGNSLSFEQFRRFLKIETYVNMVFPIVCDPSRPPGIMMWTILNLNYIRKLSYKHRLILAKWFWRRFLNDPT